MKDQHMRKVIKYFLALCFLTEALWVWSLLNVDSEKHSPRSIEAPSSIGVYIGFNLLAISCIILAVAIVKNKIPVKIGACILLFIGVTVLVICLI
jgi:hypothetical protein